MKKKGIRGLVTQVTSVSSVLTKISLRLSEGLKYEPGQSVGITVMRKGSSANPSQRFALCGDPQQAWRTNQYEVLAHTHAANGSLCGLGKVKVGDFVHVEGPIGDFNPAEMESGEEAVWLATPSGLGPFLSYVQSESFAKKPCRRILLLVDAQQETEIAFQKLFESKGVTVIPCIAQPTEWIQGFWGRAIELLKSSRFQLDFARTRFFVSAGEGVAEEIVKTLMNDRGVTRERIVKDFLHARLTSSKHPSALWIPIEIISEEDSSEDLVNYSPILRAA